MTVAPSARVSPELIVAAGCAIALITFGPRAAAGLFQIPITAEYGWGRDVFGLAIAVQNLLWGVGQPFAGAVADRFGATRVLCAGALLYALGLVVMAHATTPGHAASRRRRSDRLRAVGLLVQSRARRLGKLLPEDWRPIAFGAGTAAGSFGQFLFPPIGNVLIDALGWHQALIVFAVSVLVVLPLSFPLATRKPAPRRGGRPRPLPISRSRKRCRKRSGIAATCCWCSASSPAVSSSPSSPPTCRPISRMPGCPRRSAAGRWR